MSSDTSAPKILFVDDEEMVLSGINLTVGRTFNVRTATSGRDGLEILKEEGPFAVVVSDFNMPQMDGVEFLQQVRSMDKEVVTMLLTGGANFNEVSDAVREGGIFRLIGKPCPAEDLEDNLNQAIKQYRTIRAEKDMLEQTMNGAVRAMTSILSAAKPLYFGRAQRVKRLAFQLAEVLGIQDPWRLELAVTFYYLGFLSLPEEVQENLYHKRDVAAGIQEIIQRIPSFTESALKDIPRLDEIIEVIKSVDQDFDSSGREQEEITKLSSIIRLSKDYDEAASAGHARPKIFEWLLKNRSRYLSGGLEALSRIRDYSDGGPQLQAVKVADLKQGMRIQEDLRLSNGYLVAPQGSVVTDSFLVVLKNYRLCYANDPLPDQVEVIMGSSYADSLN
mgnify:CR=1 FL=1